MQFSDFFTQLYTQLLLPIAIPVAIIALLFAAIQFFVGNRRGVERALEVLAGTALIGFGPFIVRWFFDTARALGGG